MKICGHSFLTVFLLVVLCCGCNQGYYPNLYTEAQSPRKIYTNEEFGYTVSYPDNWFPSGIVYANAFELRNYDPKNPQSLPEKNRASIIIVDTVNQSEEATDEFLDSLLPGENTPEHRILGVDGRHAVRIYRKVPAQHLGPGASSALGPKAPVGQPDVLCAMSMYVANGKRLISLEALALAQADASVMEEINKIEESVQFH